VAAFMELRVHGPEHFFTRLALAGVDEIQLGVEALSPPLLAAMRKGTKVWQNIRAVKYLAELGIQHFSNLITHHPQSTAEDVIETERILGALAHLPPFSLSKFVVSYASPIWQQLSESQRGSLMRGFFWLPDDLRPYTTQRDLAYPYPTEWLDRSAREAWDAFRLSYSANARTAGALPELRHEEEDVVFDRRTENAVRHALDDAEVLVLRLGHEAPLIERARLASGLDSRRFNQALESLMERTLTLALDDRYLSLPLRPRSVLIANLLSLERGPGLNSPLATQSLAGLQ
jgi:hypothetical protein